MKNLLRSSGISGAFGSAAISAASSATFAPGPVPCSSYQPPAFASSTLQNNAIDGGLSATLNFMGSDKHGGNASSSVRHVNISGLDALFVEPPSVVDVGLPPHRNISSNPLRPVTSSSSTPLPLSSAADGSAVVQGGDEHYASWMNPALLLHERIDALEGHIKMLKAKQRSLLRAIKEEKKSELHRIRAQQQVLRLAHKPWSVIRVPIVTNAFKLFVEVAHNAHATEKEFIKVLMEEGEGDAASGASSTGSKKGARKGRGGGKSKKIPKIPRAPTTKALRQKWSTMKWADKKPYVIATQRNTALKRQMVNKLLEGCPDFEKFSRYIENQVTTAESFLREANFKEMGGTEGILSSSSSSSSARSRGKPLSKEIQLAWERVQELDDRAATQAAGGDAECEELVQAKLKLIHLLQGTNMHQLQNH